MNALGEHAGFTCNYRARPLWRGKRKWPTRGPNDAIDPGRVETPFIPQKLQRMGVVHVDVTV
jgi:hypothetical protein